LKVGEIGSTQKQAKASSHWRPQMAAPEMLTLATTQARDHHPVRHLHLNLIGGGAFWFFCALGHL
jgi:hypothetical protein